MKKAIHYAFGLLGVLTGIGAIGIMLTHTGIYTDTKMFIATAEFFSFTILFLVSQPK